MEELKRLAEEEQCLFRAQMLRQDVARLIKVEELARTESDLESCRRAARRLGWTVLDARMHELAEPLD